MKRRVVVTGLGAVTPIGNDVESFWNGVKEGKVGIGPITVLIRPDTRQHWQQSLKILWQRIAWIRELQEEWSLFPSMR